MIHRAIHRMEVQEKDGILLTAGTSGTARAFYKA